LEGLDEDVVEEGYLLIPSALGALGQGDHAGAHARFQAAARVRASPWSVAAR